MVKSVTSKKPKHHEEDDVDVGQDDDSLTHKMIGNTIHTRDSMNPKNKV
jgi:hypothetical protein